MEELKNCLEKYGLIYVPIDGEDSLTKIYNLWVNNIFEEPELQTEIFYYGSYYQNVEKNYDLMKKYYLLGIKLNDVLSMHNLANYYNIVEKNYDLMKKYYLLGIKLNDFLSMNNLADYYNLVEKNYDLMKKYYMMAIKLNNKISMNNLACYYEYIEKNYDLAKKYYLMAIKLGNSVSLDNLILYYNTSKDFSFIKIAVEYNITEKFISLLDEKFTYNIDLPIGLHSYFCQFKGVNKIVKMKQYILKKTGIFPKKYNDDYDIEFMELLFMCSCKKYIFPKDILLLIAGYLYV
tara:strand:+ start:1090 stop:1962 length:873 start_codon:yes stop_codon:yes gene_type:complete